MLTIQQDVNFIILELKMLDKTIPQINYNDFFMWKTIFRGEI